MNANDLNAIQPPDTIENTEQDNSTWELRMVTCTSINAKKIWSGSALCRHGGQFQQWWKHNRGDRGWEHCVETRSVMDTWDMCVYVRIENDCFEELRQQFLTSIGGQSKMYCSKHKVPFIVACKGSKCTNCIPDRCKRQAKLECPASACSSICMKCHQFLADQHDHQNTLPSNTNRIYVAYHR
jgi:hypothetical protein